MSETRTLAMVGLGKMGSNMARRLLRGGHRCVVYDVNAQSRQQMQSEGAIATDSIDELLGKLPKPRIVWMMLPAGEVTESMVISLSDRMEPGDILIDGGNSYFKDDVRRHQLLRLRGIEYLDVGTSGGIWGVERGYCLMVGGSPEAFSQVEPILRTLAPGAVAEPESSAGDAPKVQSLRNTKAAMRATAEQGYLYCGPSGAGHFVKMVHNGIEYGMMESFAEGFDILKNASSEALPEDHRYELDLGQIAQVWRRGSVVSSWLLDLIARALEADPALAQFSGYVEDSGEGRWTIQAAIEEEVPADVLATSLFKRFRSRREHSFSEKMLSAMRRQFGGHREQAPESTEHRRSSRAGGASR